MRYVWHRPNNVSGNWSHTNCDALWVECYVLVLLHCLRLCSLQSLIQLWIMHNFQVLWDNERPSVQELKSNRKWTYQCCNNPKNTNLPLGGKKMAWSTLKCFGRICRCKKMQTSSSWGQWVVDNYANNQQEVICAEGKILLFELKMYSVFQHKNIHISRICRYFLLNKWWTEAVLLLVKQIFPSFPKWWSFLFYL